MARFVFDSAVYRWQARTDAEWFFADVPAELSAEIAELQQALPRRGFGGVRVRVTVGRSTWRTSIFPAATGVYMLPLKQTVRRAEGLAEGGRVSIELEVVDL